jgi:hypothetical protein
MKTETTRTTEVRVYRAYLKNWPRHEEFEANVVRDRAALAEAVCPKKHLFEIVPVKD